MAQKGMSIKEAAARMGVSDRTLRTYIRKGYLSTTKIRGDRKLYLDPLEVEEFRRDKEEARGKSIVTKAEFLLMRASIRRLQAQMGVVLRILDAKNDPLRFSLEYSRDLFAVCLAQLHNSAWSVEELEPWVEVFLRMDELDIETIARATKEERPWKPFLQLCVSMSAYVGAHAEYPNSLELQSMHRELAEGRRRLRVSALVYAEMYGDADKDIRRYALADSPSTLTDTIRAQLRRPKT
jgi:excisionase family DNA binding protein